MAHFPQGVRGVTCGRKQDAEKSLELVLEQAWGDGLGLWLSCTASPPGGIWQHEPVAFPARFYLMH